MALQHGVTTFICRRMAGSEMGKLLGAGARGIGRWWWDPRTGGGAERRASPSTGEQPIRAAPRLSGTSVPPPQAGGTERSQGRLMGVSHLRGPRARTLSAISISPR